MGGMDRKQGREQQSPALPSRPSRLGLYLPFLLLVAVVLVWSGFWFYAASKTGEVMDQAFEREARAGRDWTCPGRSVSGFPFRIEVNCLKPTFISRMAGREGQGSLQALVVQARAIEPTRIIGTLTGPMLLKLGDLDVEANWTEARTSLATDPSPLSEFELEVRNLTVSLVGAGQPAQVAGAERLNLSAVRDGPAASSTADYKVAARVNGFTLAALDALAGNSQPLTLELQALLTRLPRVPQRDWRLGAEDWRAAGGLVKIILFDVAKGPMHLTLAGSLGLDDGHRPSGTLEASFQGLDTIAAKLGARSLAGFVRSGKLPLIASNGRIYVGPLPLATLTPLY